MKTQALDPSNGTIQIKVGQGLKTISLPQREYDSLRKGISLPQARQLSVGTKLFRVVDERDLTGERTGDSHHPSGNTSDPGAGNWWCGQKAFNKIMEYCVQYDVDHRGLGYAFREACAILFDWGSNCDVLVEAVLTKSTWVFYGPGKPKRGRIYDVRYKFSGWSDIEQLYIPNITERVGTIQDGSHIQLSGSPNSTIQVIRTAKITSINELSDFQR